MTKRQIARSTKLITRAANGGRNAVKSKPSAIETTRRNKASVEALKVKTLKSQKVKKTAIKTVKPQLVSKAVTKKVTKVTTKAVTVKSKTIKKVSNGKMDVEEEVDIKISKTSKDNKASTTVIPDVDKFITNFKDYIVSKDGNGSYGNKYLSATLNKCNMVNNNNKYYILQVVAHKSSKKVFLFKKWGRNGYTGNSDFIVSVII
jgi:hypothetical protein